MGTVVSFDLRDPVPATSFDATVAVLRHADETFSLYQPGSQLSRLVRGEIRLAQCDPDVEEVLALCAEATVRTGGWFTAMLNGSLDPSGLVKGWAVQRASEVLDDAGSRRHAVNGGGDIQFAAAEPDPAEEAWHVGIADPHRSGHAVVVAALRGGALATSGTAERGLHIIDPATGLLACHFTSVSVAATSLIDADVLATAAFARGEPAIDWLEATDGVEALFVGPGSRLTTTSSFPLF
jgi:thiamine biosynthesis lipoprotein